MPDISQPTPLLILIPVFNDWESLQMLLVQLGEVATAGRVDAQVLIVNDGSTDLNEITGPFTGLRGIEILDLRRNLGHQRAIAIGIAYLEDKGNVGQPVAVMDGDGEDAPMDLLRLLKVSGEVNGQKVVFAGRTRRSESYSFRMFYWLYRKAHFILTGYRVEVGNFCVVPGMFISRLAVVSEVWNHFAAAIYKARLPRTMVPCTRGQRLRGQSKMNFVSLVMHGLSAMSVFSDIIGVRILIALGTLILAAVLAIAGTIGVRLFTQTAIPGWAAYTTGLLLVILMQAIGIAMMSVFQILGGRTSVGFLPIRDYHYFVLRVRNLEVAPAPG